MNRRTAENKQERLLVMRFNLLELLNRYARPDAIEPIMALADEMLSAARRPI